MDQDGKSLVILDVVTGKRLLRTSKELKTALKEESETRRAAEERAEAAEAENARLRAELDQLRKGV